MRNERGRLSQLVSIDDLQHDLLHVVVDLVGLGRGGGRGGRAGGGRGGGRGGQLERLVQVLEAGRNRQFCKFFLELNVVPLEYNKFIDSINVLFRMEHY